MIQIKKTILTLALLITAVGGAWAQGPWTSGDCTVTLSNGTLTVSGTGTMDNYADPSDRPWENNSGGITSVVVESGVTSVGMAAFYYFTNMTSVTLPEGLTAICDLAFSDCTSLQSITIPSTVTSIGGMAFNRCSSLTSLTLPEGLTAIGDMAFYECTSLTSITLSEGLTAIGVVAFYGCSSLTSITIPSTVTSIGAMAFSSCSAISDVNLYANPDNLTWGEASMGFKDGKATQCHVLADHLSTYQTKFSSANVTFVGDLKSSSASGPEVAWDKATKTGTFKMPGGNVTLEPEYYPQAALATAPTAINDVPATTDGAIVSAGTVANIGETTTAQGTVMYHVSKTALDDAALLALAADQWTADVPTAADLAEGTAYVYYYVRGNDSDTDAENFSDGDILAANALTVTIAAEPTYAVTFAEGTDANEWKAEPAAGVKKGTDVTVTYTGSKKVIGVKAEKKAAVTYPLLSAATTSDIGKVVCAAGHLHDAKTAVPDGCTAVGIVGKVTSTGHGLILALKDATSQTWNTINGWTSASYAGTTLKVLPDAGARGNLSSYETLGETTVSNWAVAQKSDYEAIFTNLGSTVSDSYGTTYDGNVNAYITTGVGGTAITSGYWSATYDGGNYSWIFSSEYWDSYIKSNSVRVRPVLGF